MDLQPAIPTPQSPGTATPTIASTIAPATGKLVAVLEETTNTAATLRLPKHARWSVFDEGSSGVVCEAFDFPLGPKTFAHVRVSIVPQLGTGLDEITETARDARQTQMQTPLTIGKNRAINSIDGYVIQGATGRFQFYEWGGLNSKNVLTVLSFTVPRGANLADWAEPVLESIRWRK
ncbi:hypothetical protein UM93_09070 [Psychromicrobium lacuslunae]|uniref:Lipoprotein LpqN n=2 Tax=Psychromicrobium lacuslunae TaxID=1618207 RepID=A0A0D4BZV0_9MICC|nr:hypothetical protein UM93_09070 [Psychromicrobium lacuslunae]